MKHAGLLLLLIACAPRAPEAEVCQVPLDMTDFDTARVKYPLLSSTCLLTMGPSGELVDHEEALVYDLNTPLFSDYAAKHRTVFMPPGMSAAYSDTEVFDLPVGTIITKTFIQSGQAIETRLLVRGTDEWFALPYVWEGTDAKLQLGGDILKLAATRPDGSEVDVSYLIPNGNQCAQCHARHDIPNEKKIHPIGLTARSLNRDGQLESWIAAGKLTGAPAAAFPRLANWTDPAASLNDRARAWLEMNCAHCHNQAGEASNTGLYLFASNQESEQLGFCKKSVSAGAGAGGRPYDVWPGHPEKSIMAFRIEATKPNLMMPELGRSVVHVEGAALIEQWISSLPGDCPAP